MNKIIIWLVVAIGLVAMVSAKTTTIRDTVSDFDAINATNINATEGMRAFMYYFVSGGFFNETNTTIWNEWHNEKSLYPLSSSLTNVTMQQINNSFGNLSQWLGTYPNVDKDSTDDVTFTSIVSLDLVNGSYVNASITAHNASMKSYVDAQDISTNASMKNYVDTQDTLKYDKTGGTISGSVLINGNLTIIGSYVEANVTNMNLNGSGTPEIDNLFNWGASALRWANGYFTTLYGSLGWGNLTGVPDFALASSLPNVTMQQINNSFGNLSQWLSTYPNVDTDSTNDLDLNTVTALDLRNGSQVNASIANKLIPYQTMSDTATNLSNYQLTTSAYQNSNFTTQYDSITSRFSNSNFTTLYAAMGYYTLTNFTAHYATMGYYTDTNASALISTYGNITYANNLTIYQTRADTATNLSIYLKNDSAARLSVLNVTGTSSIQSDQKFMIGSCYLIHNTTTNALETWC